MGELGIISSVGYDQRFIIKRLAAILTINGYSVCILPPYCSLAIRSLGSSHQLLSDFSLETPDCFS